jgi:hypothetical protein
MNETPLYDTRYRDWFWAVVVACLREFHGRTLAESTRMAMALRKEIDEANYDPSDIFYHAEPFNIAMDMADRRLKESVEVLKKYVQMRDEKYADMIADVAKPHAPEKSRTKSKIVKRPLAKRRVQAA